ncbi:MAG: substrate-binding domain-containing protein [Clostridia bacterium]|nr:substrate-binding domain-containing protein [Clostridia bacterium]
MNSLSRKMAKRVLLTLLMLSTLLFPACGSPSKTNQSNPDKKIVIGFSMATLKEDRWLQDRDIFTAKAKQAGFEVIVKNANNDSDLQFEQVNEMIAKGIDVLVITPQDSVDAARCVNAAKKAGIPVVSYDRLVRNANVDVYVSFDNVKVGKVMGEAIKKVVPEGGYIILNGSETDNNSQMFNKGYMSELKDLIGDKKITIVGEIWVKDWRREEALDFVSEILKKDGDKVKAIIAANDSLAWAAIDAISVARLSGKIKVVGHDADLAACQRIVEGTQLLTVYKPIKNLVDQTITICRLLVEKKQVPHDTTISNGNFTVPYVMIDVIPVTKDNIDDTVIKDGFHLKEDVYRKDKD